MMAPSAKSIAMMAMYAIGDGQRAEDVGDSAFDDAVLG
jgi:hypothetical protein